MVLGENGIRAQRLASRFWSPGPPRGGARARGRGSPAVPQASTAPLAAAARGRAPTPVGLAAGPGSSQRGLGALTREAAGRPDGRRGPRGLGGDSGPYPGGRQEGALRGRPAAARSKCRLRRLSRLRCAAGPPQPRGPRCRPGRGATMPGPGACGGRGSRPSRSCSGAGSRSGGGTTRSSCSSSSTWSPCESPPPPLLREALGRVMKNLLLGLSRKMRLSRKTVYQMYQATNMPRNFWLTHQPKDFGCHWGKKSKLCSDTAVETVTRGFYL
ncbi:translation initiation factor IF-2-like [Lutra lutra]|uniref:translation initiation factor IF-2-like n=1 Tax=Lutra lutra TaxID=9657 RepID=UPI001FD4B995|nr:translation initiation factor IF-2-like [Lutra lutra]